jgi:hypothetical protein
MILTLCGHGLTWFTRSDTQRAGGQHVDRSRRKSVSVTAPIDVDLQHEPVLTVDDLVIIEQPAEVVIEQPAEVVVATPLVQRDPVMLFVYLGILSLIAIVAIAASLAF